MWILYIVLAAIAACVVLFSAVLLIRAALAKKKADRKDLPRKNVTAEKQAEYAQALAELIRCETVADGQHGEQFEKFRQTLKRLFPLLHARAQLSVFGSGCLVYKIEGKNAIKNVMLMSHHDVVKADGEWREPPFGGVVRGGILWGRGTVDTKTPLFAELTAMEELLREDFAFEGVNVYIGSSNNEEICGDGMPTAVAYFKEQGVRFDTVLDEGGAIVCGMMPGVARKSAMVAVHEKGRHVFRCTAATSDKGHLGLNPAQSNVVDVMSEFVCDVKKSKLFRTAFYPEVKQMFLCHAPYMTFPMRLLFANFGVFRPLLKRVMPKISAQVRGMLGTTMHFTSVDGGGETPQIQAKTVTSTAFFRCVREEVLQKELTRFKAIAERHGVTAEEELRDYCRPFDAAQPQFKALQATLNENFPDVIVSPFLLTAGTDARHFSDVADCILRFAPIDLNKQQFASVHNPDENIAVENVGECVCFYKDFVRRLCAETPEK